VEPPERPGIGTNELVSSFVLCLFTSGNVANVPLLFLGNLDERTWNSPNEQELERNELVSSFVLVCFTLGNVTNVSLSFF